MFETLRIYERVEEKIGDKNVKLPKCGVPQLEAVPKFNTGDAVVVIAVSLLVARTLTIASTYGLVANSYHLIPSTTKNFNFGFCVDFA
jgi:hypothetical protein